MFGDLFLHNLNFATLLIQRITGTMSRQILSSPFDWDVHQKVEEDGSSVATSNIMVDTRVVRRRTFNASSTKNAEDTKLSTEQPCISFDRRLILGDIFANPIITVTGEDAKKQTMKRPAECGQRTISTPPPVKGRHHVSVQTDDTDTIGVCERAK